MGDLGSTVKCNGRSGPLHYTFSPLGGTLPSRFHPYRPAARKCRRPHLALLLALSTIAAGQDRIVEPEDTFRTATRLVVVDVVVTDRSGKPVRDLSGPDFTVLEDGVPQTIASFEAPEPVADQAVQKTDTPQRPRESTGSSKAPTQATPPALNILVLDELNSEVIDQAYARRAIEKFLRQHGPQLAQPTSLMILGQKRLELLHDFTLNAAALAEALHRRHAELPFGLMTAEFGGAGERLSKSLWALQQIAAANNRFEGRKNVIWVGPGFPMLNPMQALDPADRPRFQAVIREDANILVEARVSIYTVNPRGLEVSPVMYGTGSGDNFFTGTQDQTTGELLFENLAPLTGGRIVRLRNDVDAAISESVEDGAAYYSVAYYPSNHRWNGKFRRIEVKLGDATLRARTRQGYFAVPDAPLTDPQIDTVLSRAVMSPLPYRALTVAVSAKSAGPQRGRFMVNVEAQTLSWETLPGNKRRCEVTVVIASVGAGDKVYSHKVTELESVVDATHFAVHLGKPVTFRIETPLPPKTRYVRVVVRDARNDHIGSADLPREVLPFH